MIQKKECKMNLRSEVMVLLLWEKIEKKNELCVVGVYVTMKGLTI